MMKPAILCLCVPLAFAIAAVSPPAKAQDPPDRRAQVIEAAALADYVVQVDLLCNLVEDLVFWQSVAIMGDRSDWTFEYSAGNIEPFTYRLYNAIDESELAAVRAVQSIDRNAAITEEDRQAAFDLRQDFDRMRTVSETVYAVLRGERDGDAAQIFREETLGLRRDVVVSCFSATDPARSRLSRLGLNARLDR